MPLNRLGFYRAFLLPSLRWNVGSSSCPRLVPVLTRSSAASSVPARHFAMKRKAAGTLSPPKTKRRTKTAEDTTPDYCDAEPQRDEEGIVWPAAREAMEEARQFIREAATSGKRVLLVPDKDADGLSAGVIAYRTLLKLGLSETNLDVHLLSKNTTVHDQSERNAMQSKNPDYVIVLDMGSRPAPRIVENAKTKCLIIDHHLSDEFPQDAQWVSACHFPPVATSALLTWEICRELHPDLGAECAYLCAIGTVGDLGTSLKWKPPFPDLSATFKEHTKKEINVAVSFINAPRRSAEYNVKTAWDALLASSGPRDVTRNKRLHDAREAINMEVEKHTHTPPKFSKDGRIAVLKINTPAQIHPVIATRWAGHLKSPRLEIVMVANYGYQPGKVNFSCRIAKVAVGRDPPVNIISTLKEIAALDEGDLVARMGESFARGHKEASGGIIPEAEFEELMGLIKLGEKPDKPIGGSGPSPKKSVPQQRNNLMNYFAVK